MSERLKQLIAMAEQDPADPFLMFALALEYQKVDDKNKADQLYQKLMAMHPGYAGSYYHAAKLKMEIADYSSAKIIAEAGLKREEVQQHARTFRELSTLLAEINEEID